MSEFDEDSFASMRIAGLAVLAGEYMRLHEEVRLAAADHDHEAFEAADQIFEEFVASLSHAELNGIAMQLVTCLRLMVSMPRQPGGSNE